MRVEVLVEVIAGELRLEVRNDMAGAGATPPEGIGLRNVRERLAVQFNASARFGAGPAGPGRWAAAIEMPLLREPPANGTGP